MIPIPSYNKVTLLTSFMIRKKKPSFFTHTHRMTLFGENINIGYLKLDIAEAKTNKNIKTMFDLMQLWTSTVFNYYNLSKNFGSFASKDATFIPSFMERHFTPWTKTGFVSLILWCPSQSWSDPNSQITLRYFRMFAYDEYTHLHVWTVLWKHVTFHWLSNVSLQ